MPTHAELAGRLLKDAAGFFRMLSEQNEPVKKDMAQNAEVFEQVADLIVRDPEGRADESPFSELAARLLRDAAQFFRTLSEQNEPLKEQMTENANVFDQIASLVEKNPLGILD